MIIFIDIDDCLNHMKDFFVQRAVELKLISKPRPVIHWDLKEFFNNKDKDIRIKKVNKILNSRNFWLDIPVKEDAPDVLEYLNKNHEVYLSTAPWWGNEKSILYKKQWVNKNFPFIKNNQMIYINKKWLLKGDIIVDDKPITVEKFDGISILFDNDFNRHRIKGCNARIKNWKEIYAINGI